MDEVDYSEVARAYAAERPRYQALASWIGNALQHGLTRHGLEGVVAWRAKEVASVVKKALRKGHGTGHNHIRDKAGIRVIVHYLDDVSTVEKIVEECCNVIGRETKVEALEYDQLGYLGVHLDVCPREAQLSSDQRDLGSLHAEVQIHTKAQSAWSVVSHQLLYKAPVTLPADLKRGVTRLVALVELFDAEIQRLRGAIRMSPSFTELSVLEALEGILLRYSRRRPDRALSALSLPSLLGLYDIPSQEIVPRVVSPFVERNNDKLEALFQAYNDDSRANPLLFQPEALIVFERLDNNVDALVEAWPDDVLPRPLIVDLATVWGVDVES